MRLYKVKPHNLISYVLQEPVPESITRPQKAGNIHFFIPYILTTTTVLLQKRPPQWMVTIVAPKPYSRKDASCHVQFL